MTPGWLLRTCQFQEYIQSQDPVHIATKLSILKCKASKETRVYTKVKHTTRINYVIRLLKHFRGNVLVAICQPVHLSDVGFFELWICCYAVLCI